MESEHGREPREKSWAIREKAAEALQDTGSSTKALDKFTQIWSRLAKPRNPQIHPPHANSIDVNVDSHVSGVGSS
ncbi:hypothetical protein NL676_028105 [Syzygium grande]|nr:hypothetical protein NL676_028105 [Syzygium grande]